MRRKLALGEWMGGVFRGPRAVYAVAPLFLPLIFATVHDRNAAPASVTEPAANFLPLQYERTLDPKPLPAHSFCVKITSGDTLSELFTSGGLSSAEAHELATEFGKAVDPRRLRLGDLVHFYVDEKQNVQAIDLKVSGWGNIRAERSGEHFSVRPVEAPQRAEEITVEAAVDSSLYDAVKDAGESPALVSELVEVFQWDVDFFRLREGDAFRIVVQKKYAGEDAIGYGPILAAQFKHNGQLFEAFRSESGGVAGYYTRTGAPIKKQFLRAPLKFSRVTSNFSLRRFHPVLQRFRPHYGVDYGAPVGTPVMSTADGVVVKATFDRGEGNYIRVRHNARIETNYLHLSRFAAGIRPGTRVKQGDVIGYVGATGLATGPHLDYRVSDGGKWLNPKDLKSITADPLGGAALRQFRANVARYMSKLDARSEQLASNRIANGLRALF